MSGENAILKALIGKGVDIPDPSGVYVGEDVDPARISGKGVVIHPGCRILGRRTLIMDGANLGQEAPATVDDCLIGPEVQLKGGYFQKSVFLKGSNMASGAHVREACILEEESSCAHCVGLKHTILFPFVALGSLINFCDCLMAGGTSRKDHSEVGSSYIHFNYTPNQDKATASLIGDVPRGVMLDQRPIFLGGQGGLVGPAVIGFGAVTAAGTIVRESHVEDGGFITGSNAVPARKKFIPGFQSNLKAKVRNNIRYLANLIAMKAWYTQVRILLTTQILEDELVNGAVGNLDLAVHERITRLKGMTDKLPKLDKTGEDGIPEFVVRQQEELAGRWNQVAEVFQAVHSHTGSDQARESFLAAMDKDIQDKTIGYIPVIRGLSAPARKLGTDWLSGIVQEIVDRCLEKIPLFR